MPIERDALRLDGRVAIVTGAAQGIGRAIATAFARFGANLALCDRDAEGLAACVREAQGEGARVISDVCDVRDEALLARFFEAVGAAFPRIDVLVNNAGGGFHSGFLDVNSRGREALIRENFTQLSECVRRAVPCMGEGASIINITSIEAHRAAPGYAIYSAMKAAVANLSKSLALELGGRGIRVNCIAPDVIPTPGVGDTFPPTPLAHSATVDDVAGAALFLASDLSRFISGTTLHVDGGNLAAAGWRRLPDGRWGI